MHLKGYFITTKEKWVKKRMTEDKNKLYNGKRKGKNRL